MKALMLVTLLGVAGYFTYKNHFEANPTTAAVLQAIQKPAARLAPNGTFFITERHSEVTDTGVQAVSPGTKVKALGAPELGRTKVRTEDGLELIVPEEILTNDLDIIDQVLATVSNQIQKAQEEADANTAIGNQQVERELKAKHREVQRLGIHLGELSVSRQRAIEKLELEVAKSKNVSITGSATFAEQQARAALAEVDKNIRKTEIAIENLQLSIRRKEFRDF
jgi:hypothetical protein